MKKDIFKDVWEDWWSFSRVILTITIPILLAGIYFNLKVPLINEAWFETMDMLVNIPSFVSSLAIILLIFLLIVKIIKAKKHER